MHKRQHTRRKRQKKAAVLLMFLQLLRNILSAGAVAMAAVLFCRLLLSPESNSETLSGFLLDGISHEPVTATVVTAFEGSAPVHPKAAVSTDTASPLPEKPAEEYSSWLEVSDTRIYKAEIYETQDSGTDASGVVSQSGHRLQVPDEAEVERILGELAGHDSDIAEIYARRSEYPKELLAALALNQEMTDFVKGFLTADGTATGGISDEEKAQTFPLFLQWDKRWGYVPYGSGTISITGCGPTCLSMVIFSLTGDESATPDALATLSMNKGYYMKGAGTTWQFMTDAASWYGLSARELSLDEAVIRQYLDQGCPIICAMRPGDFTATGHFIVLVAYDQNGYRVNDPNSRARSEKYWSFDALKGQIRNLWGYSMA